ncbi:TCP Interactor containing EAR motif protein 2 [Hibiscus trionum]|uniref:TCP Interactor containing EAR motif protein 2 n=1 Tax=Hibiscus trionum TaxID=183268 RepID=A0A9W7I7M6_HIBTR|nr:TCP Interactor containing EAR motif protein 2 [Hibiscus trionum]
MSSSYYGEANMGNERGGSSRKGKKSNSDKPKQPQRGLGVAQLEKIRLHEQMGCSYHPSLFNQEDTRVQQQTAAYSSSSSTSSASYGFHPGIMVGIGEYDHRANISYGDSQPSTAASWNTGSGILDSQHYAHPNMTRQLLNAEDLQSKKSKKHRSSSLGSGSQNSESSETQELDLELRLSL